MTALNAAAKPKPAPADEDPNDPDSNQELAARRRNEKLASLDRADLGKPEKPREIGGAFVTAREREDAQKRIWDSYITTRRQ